MQSGQMWTSPWADEDVALFTWQMRKRYGGNTTILNRPLPFGFTLSATDGVDPAGKNPVTIDLVQLASSPTEAAGAVDDTTTHWPGAPTTRAQNPKLTGEGQVAQGQAILVGGMAGVVQMGIIECRGFDADPSDPAGSWGAVAAANDAQNGIMAAFDASLLTLADNTLIVAEALGHEVWGFGASRVGVFGPPTIVEDGTVDTMVYAGQYSGKERVGRRLAAPVYFDGGGGDPARVQSVIKLALTIPRKAAWPIPTGTRFGGRVWLDVLWAYNATGVVSDCDPGDQGEGGGPGYSDSAGARQRIVPPSRW